MARARGFSGGRRRPMSWVFGPLALNVAISADGKTQWTTAISSTEAEQTIVRYRGGGAFNLLTAAAAGDGFTVGLGVAVFTIQAEVAGAASVPGPLTDTDWDGWLWHQVFVVQAITATISDGVNAMAASHQFEIDSKAMRKWDGGAEVIGGVLEVIEHGTATAEFNAHGRMLIKT